MKRTENAGRRERTLWAESTKKSERELGDRACLAGLLLFLNDEPPEKFLLTSAYRYFHKARLCICEFGVPFVRSLRHRPVWRLPTLETRDRKQNECSEDEHRQSDAKKRGITDEEQIDTSD